MDDATSTSLSQEEIDYHTANHLRLLLPLLERLGQGASKVSDGYVDTNPPDESFTELGWFTVDHAIEIARRSAERLFDMMGGPGDRDLLEEASVFLTVAACALAGMKDSPKPGMNGPWAAMGLVRMLEALIARAEERERASDHDTIVEELRRLRAPAAVKEVAHV